MGKVLIVDDSQLTRNFHSYLLREAGFEVTTAVDGEEGLCKLSEGGFDLVLTDLNMQGMDGYEFTRRIRENDAHDDLPIVIVSSQGRDSDKERGLAAGANLFLVKPSNPKHIVNSIKTVLRPERSR
jgi:two-component system chemotaxis response regulator CheY